MKRFTKLSLTGLVIVLIGGGGAFALLTFFTGPLTGALFSVLSATAVFFAKSDMNLSIGDEPRQINIIKD